MQLVEQGRLRLDDPVDKYLPEFANLSTVQSFDGRSGAYTLRPASKKVAAVYRLADPDHRPGR